MKANESIPKYNAKVREYTNYAARQVKDVCKTVGSRPAGGENETKAQERFAEELKKSADSVSVEPFSLSPKAYLGWALPFAVIMIVANVLFFFGFGVASLALAAVSLFFVGTEFFLGGSTLDPFFKKSESRNVVAVRKSGGEIKRRVILCGHADSSYTWRFKISGGKNLISLFLVGVVVTLAAAAYCVARGGLLQAPENDFIVTVVKWVLLAWCVEFLITAFFINFKTPVEGANELTGAFAAMAAMKYLSDNEFCFENVEVCAVITGGADAGLRGAKALVKAHRKEWNGTETVFIGVDALHDFDAFALNAKADPKAAALLKQAAQNAGVELQTRAFAGDAAVIGKAGVSCATLAAGSAATAKLYGTKADNVESLSLKAIEGGVNILLETVFLCDEQGLTAQYHA